MTQRFIFPLPNFGSGGSHLCIKLKATTKNNDAGGCGFSELDTEGDAENPPCSLTGAKGKRVGFWNFKFY